MIELGSATDKGYCSVNIMAHGGDSLTMGGPLDNTVEQFSYPSRYSCFSFSTQNAAFDCCSHPASFWMDV